MSKTISSFTVDKVSLLSASKAPAVPKAGFAYSILKFFKGSPKLSEIRKSELAGIAEKLANLSAKPSPDVSSAIAKFESAAGKTSPVANDIEKTG